MTLMVIGLLGTFLLSLLAVPQPAQAQQVKKVFRVGFLSTINPRSAPVFVTFEQRMRELGYVEGQNWIFEFRNAEGRVDRLTELATELARLPVDVLVAPGPEAVLRAASQATRTIPIVMMAVNYDPLAKGYIDSLARPGGNITGVVFQQVQLSPKRLEILREALPEATRVAALWDAYTADQLQATAATAPSLKFQLQSVELRNPPYDFKGAIDTAVRGGAQGLVVLSSPSFIPKITEIGALTIKNRLPAIFLFQQYVRAGGLMAYGVNLHEMFRQGADYVDNVLKGTAPGDLPVERPKKFELVINRKTANAFGLKIPTLLYRADKVIK